MKCYNHTNKESMGVCGGCGKGICEECAVETRDKIYCRNCLKNKVASEQVQTPPPHPYEYLESKQDARRYANLGLMFGIIGLIFAGFLFGIFAIYFGSKANEIDSKLGNGGIFLGIIDFIWGFVSLIWILMNFTSVF